MKFIKTPVKGMRDILPADMELRQYLISKIKATYASFGYAEIETPCVEHIENLSGRQGGDNEKLIYKILKRGEKLNTNVEQENDLVDSGLRYDLTVPLARYYANNVTHLLSPFKAMQVGNVWRAERNQKGRFRQFVQCDIDILGDKTILAEIDLLVAISRFFATIDFENFFIRINDRKILKGMAKNAGFAESDYERIFIALDKMDKIGLEGVKSELIEMQLEKSAVEKYLQFFNGDSFCVDDIINNDGLSQFIDSETLGNLKQIIETVAKVTSARVLFDPTLVRGMNYYTGTIFEVGLEGLSYSVAGGGRYDEMIEKFSNQKTYACGISIGFERIVDYLKEKGFSVPKTGNKIAYLIDDDTNLSKVFEMVKSQQAVGNSVTVQRKAKNIKYQVEMLEERGYSTTKL